MHAEVCFVIRIGAPFRDGNSDRDGAWTELASLNIDLPAPSAKIKGATQIARDITEKWAARELYCPACPQDVLEAFPANRPVADLYCANCSEQFELKATKSWFGKRLANGAYAKKLERLQTDTSPSLVLLRYDHRSLEVLDVAIVPARFFTRSIVRPRPPLAPTARRAGWVGSTICLDLVPNLGRIAIVADKVPLDKNSIRKEWARTAFVEDMDQESRGWLADVLSCIDRIPGDTFLLNDIYAFEGHLQQLHPGNSNVRPKIRQQLQVLRDQGLIEFTGRGSYRKLSSS